MREAIAGAETLEVRDYERVFAVLEATQSARDLADFYERLTGSVGREFGIRHVTCFRGQSLRAAFHDQTPLATNDHTRGRRLDEYKHRWVQHDVFATTAALRVLEQRSMVTMREIGPLSARSSDYVAHFLTRRGICALGAFTFRVSPSETALIGAFDPDEHRLSGADALALRLLSRHLEPVARAVAAPGAGEPAPELTERQRELAALVAQGLTNAAIARRLCLSEETVKKYVSRLLRAVGCATRTELAVRALGWT